MNALASREVLATRVDSTHGTVVVSEEVFVGDWKDIILCLILWRSHVVDDESGMRREWKVGVLVCAVKR